MHPDIKQEIDDLIKNNKLQPHPEGGLYMEKYRSKDSIHILDPRYTSPNKVASTHILFLLIENDYSGWHSIKSDEIWHFHTGSALLLSILNQETKELEKVILGNPLIEQNAQFTHVIPADTLFAAEVIDKNKYSFIGCTVSPGFDFNDFYLAKREDLDEYREHNGDGIYQLVRELQEPEAT